MAGDDPVGRLRSPQASSRPALRAPVPLLQREREFDELLRLYRDEAPRRVLELGIGPGGSLFHWLNEAREDAPVTVVAVDTFSEFDSRELFPIWTPPNVELHVIAGRSNDAQTIAQVFAIAPVYDWVFIDGDHSFDCVSRDWRAYGKTASTVVFHDIVSDPYSHPEIEVALLWDELSRRYACVSFVEDDAQSWGGIGVLWPQRD